MLNTMQKYLLKTRPIMCKSKNFYFRGIQIKSIGDTGIISFKAKCPANSFTDGKTVYEKEYTVTVKASINKKDTSFLLPRKYYIFCKD